jgi:hypothetical protein
MPLYTVFSEEGSISNKTRAKIAEEITRIHTDVMKAPTTLGHVSAADGSRHGTIGNIAPGNSFA